MNPFGYTPPVLLIEWCSVTVRSCAAVILIASAAAIVETVDVLPTLCELTNLAIPEKAQGTSFVPLLRAPQRAGDNAAFGWMYRKTYSAQTIRVHPCWILPA